MASFFDEELRPFGFSSSLIIEEKVSIVNCIKCAVSASYELDDHLPQTIVMEARMEARLARMEVILALQQCSKGKLEYSYTLRKQESLKKKMVSTIPGLN